MIDLRFDVLTCLILFLMSSALLSGTEPLVRNIDLLKQRVKAQDELVLRLDSADTPPATTHPGNDELEPTANFPNEMNSTQFPFALNSNSKQIRIPSKSETVF